ncbi:MAG: hypothetical protein E7505_05940 [Ruminococcus sp.]|nr:hypothetical protein [Ruminococcus sp.]
MVKKTKLLGKIISCISGIALALTCVGSDIYSEEYGVDISRYQGDIDWDKFSESGMSFAILRTGTTKYGEDSRFEEYYAGTRKIGIKTGAYLYISALTLEEFRSAAYTFIDYLDDKEWEMPVYIDLEDEEQTTIGRHRLTTYAIACMNIIREAGYTTGLYTNQNWLTNFIDGDLVRKAGFEIWFARYPDRLVDPLKYDKSDICGIWQYSCYGKVEGIPYAWVDLNIAYKIYNEKRKPQAEGSIWLLPYLSRKVMRCGAGKEYGIITPVPHNTCISVTETIQNKDGLWGKFEYNGYVGWCELEGALDLSVQSDPDPYMFYDVNIDGVIDFNDDMEMRRYLLDYDAYTAGADLNGDGKVNVFDFQRIKAYLINASG